MQFDLLNKLVKFMKSKRKGRNMMKDINYEETLEYECMFVKEQVKSLQKLACDLQDELESKDKIITNLAKEKERLLQDIKKAKRSNLNLKQQLEDERSIYLKEKEFYSKEMCENKLWRKKQMEEFKNLEEIVEQNKEIENLKIRISELNNVLHNTLQANYNLSVKFLRMKNTKYSLKAKLKREQMENSKIIANLVTNLEGIREEINHIISEKFNQVIPPSNKKYLQVLKQNTQLLYTNLNQQLELSKLYNLIERIKADKIKYETSLRLQYTRKRTPKARKHAERICEVDVSTSTNPQSVSTINEEYEETRTSRDYKKSLKDTLPKHTRRTHSAPELNTFKKII